MNARIEARNHAEGGAEFRLALRLSEEPLAQVGEAQMNADSKAATS